MPAQAPGFFKLTPAKFDSKILNATATKPEKRKRVPSIKHRAKPKVLKDRELIVTQCEYPFLLEETVPTQALSRLPRGPK